MALCKGCGATFQWGFCDGKWVPLEPVATHDDMARTYVDENGVLRADHRDKHGPGQSSINVTRLDRKIQPLEAAVFERVEEGDVFHHADGSTR